MSDLVEYPKSWRFHADDGTADGAVFTGRFTGVIEQGESSYGPKPIARFIEEVSGEERSIWLFQQSLLDQLTKLAPEKGELVEISWHGKKKSKSSKYSYHSFKAVAPERPVIQLSWGDLATAPDEDDEPEY